MVRPTRRRRRSWNQAGFWLLAPLLLASILLEGIYNMMQLLVFPLRRSRERARIRDVMARGGKGLGVASLVLAAIGVPGLGCQNTHPGSSFGKQVYETKSSIYDLLAMPEWWESLTDDVVTLSDPELDQLPETIELLGW